LLPKIPVALETLTTWLAVAALLKASVGGLTVEALRRSPVFPVSVGRFAFKAFEISPVFPVSWCRLAVKLLGIP
tara:strand:+ start:293 stop:514 length:222 start_codon:yes stop_codon:yes gene_type:complete